MYDMETRPLPHCDAGGEGTRAVRSPRKGRKVLDVRKEDSERKRKSQIELKR
jgi:hypothetical protein